MPIEYGTSFPFIFINNIKNVLKNTRLEYVPTSNNPYYFICFKKNKIK